MSENFVTKDEYNELVSKFNKIQKQMKKLLKTMKNECEDDNSPKRICGFLIPTQISEELATFLNIDKDELIARTQVTKLISTYVKEHNLQNPENKREIFMNHELQKLINIPDDVTLSFFNLQKYIKHHYIIKKVDVETESEINKTNSDVNEENNNIKKKVRKKIVKK